MEKEKLLDAIRKALDESPDRKFTQTLEACFNFEGVNVEGEHKINSSVNLPKGRGKDLNIGFFASGDMKERAKKISGFVLDKDELEAYAKDKVKMRKFANECHAFIAQADLMPIIGKNWGIVLGPRNKMPQPLPPNAPLEPVYERLKNSVKIRTKKKPILHVAVGVEDMTPEDLFENLKAVMGEIEKVIREEHIKSIYLKTTMGPAVRAW